jgi:ribosomal protein S10
MLRRYSTALNSFTKKALELKTPLEIPNIPQPERTANRLVCNMKFQGFMDDHLDFVAYFAMKTGHKMGMPTSDVIQIPAKIEKWYVNKGPFVHAKTKEVFERITYTRLIQVFDSHPDVVKEWIQYVNKNLPAGIHLKIEEFEWVEMKFADKNAERKKTTQEQFEERVMGHVQEYLKKFDSK